MAISRLLQVKSRFHLHGRGTLKPIRWCSSTSSCQTEKSSQLKKSGAAKEQRAAAVESYVKKYMEMHPGVFPKATHVQNKVGGSWYILKDILTNIKEKMLGNPQLQNHTTSDTSNSTVDATASVVITSHNSQDKSELGEPKNTVINSHCNKNNISKSETSVTSHLRETSSEDMIDATRRRSNPDNTEVDKPESMVQPSKAAPDSHSDEKNISDATASEVIKMHNSPDSTELSGAACIVQLSESGAGSYSTKKDILTSAASQIIGENYSEDIVRSDDILDSSKLVEPMEALSGILASFERDQKSKSEQLHCLKKNILSEVTRTLQNVAANKSASTGYGNYQPENKMTTSSQTSEKGSEVGEVPASFGGTLKVKGLVDLFMRRNNGAEGEMTNKKSNMRRNNDGAGGEMTNKKSDTLTSNGLSEYINETTGEDMPTSFDIKGLIDCIKELPREQLITKPQDNIISNKTDKGSNGGLVKGIQSHANLQKFGNQRKQTSLNGHAVDKKSEEKPGIEVPFEILRMDSKSEDEEGNDADVTAFDWSKPTSQVPLPMRKEDMDMTWDSFYAEKVSDQNKLLVSFLHKTAEKSDLVSAFKDCGDIMKIEFSYVEGSLFKTAYIHFKTREGLEKAIGKTDLMLRTGNVATVEAASSLDGMPNRISIPNLIGDPDVPAALVKNPTRTVMIKQLTHDISSHHIEEALAFCESNITGFFLGCSSSVAYVEFETEDAKERALAKHSIVVLGKRLFIFRIDAPRTTVVRISNLDHPGAGAKVNSICKSCGQVKCVYTRSRDTVDVHFKLVEWPNMLEILNRLNGMQLNGHQLLARPATVFPPDVLCILWRQPDERRRVKAVMQSLFQKLGENAVHKAGLTELASKFYGDEI